VGGVSRSEGGGGGGPDPGLDDIGEVEAEAHIARNVTVIAVPPAAHYCIAPPCLPHIHSYLKLLHTTSVRPHTLVA
jgi:hypothetical protein